MTGPTSPIDPDAVLTEVRGRVMIITLNRPGHKNAINTSMSLGLCNAIDKLDSDPNLAVGVLGGSGEGFCSGLDLKLLAKEGMPKGLFGFCRDGSKKPLIAAIEGFALAGGLEVALTCDLLVAANGAMFGIMETKVGLFAAGGALLRLTRHLPYGVAMEMALTATPIFADEAYRYGLVTHLSEPGRTLDTAFELATRIAGNAPLGVMASKQVLRQALGRTEEEFWEMQLPHIKSVFSSSDAKEGPLAFAQKREPQWTGT